MLTVLLVDDDAEFTDVACTIIEFLGHEVLTAANLAEAKEWLSKETFDHILLDFMLPDGSGLHLLESLPAGKQPRVTLITGHPSVKGIIKDMCGSNVDYLVKPIQREDLESVFSQKKTASSKKAQPAITKHFGQLIGESAPMQELYKLVSRVSRTKANVMLLGESGVGKEVVAAAIHAASECEGPYVATNCGAFSKELIGSELFGHEKGAFTGAVGRKEGVFEQAENGTLFLDEITEMPIDMQPNLLRVLENKVVIRVGGTKAMPVNCRVVSATNRSMQEIAESKVLREDIYFRLAVFPITIPPLRERKEDIPLLAEYFINQLNAENDTRFKWQPEQLEKLKTYDWPGNVRELRHFVHRAAIMSDPDSESIELPKTIESPFAKKQTLSTGLKAGRTIEEVEKELIYATLEKVDGNKTTAAEMLGISTKTLYNRLHAYGDLSNDSE
ncbi:sigma-54-dependent transcriptional regulator [Alteromonas lipolytica]|uniref:Sigma-54-dependent Fis family transcriptional regulator n=1 Tax=Alteromonas lipolytica TaxID=1856405 RepID=A0A1E8FFY3_9ALTE|nr:sigma-54 dependent transcriptional regulator [Alteromonas lipolytica]OFI34867.1 sigma-54-dependent Fis family transcriptional regulator [Alteromonas lipolytica]GGF54668.1 sigma-54-dependent Fis family transcriptional regulator [Alteromonas lipolytica]